LRILTRYYPQIPRLRRPSWPDLQRSDLCIIIVLVSVVAEIRSLQVWFWCFADHCSLSGQYFPLVLPTRCYSLLITLHPLVLIAYYSPPVTTHYQLTNGYLLFSVLLSMLCTRCFIPGSPFIIYSPLLILALTLYHLLITHYSLLLTLHPLLLTPYPLSTTHYYSLPTHYTSPPAHHYQPTTKYPFTIHYLLFTGLLCSRRCRWWLGLGCL
jgi:hypothetical protein